MGFDADARSAQYFRLVTEPTLWTVEQTLVDPSGDGEWRVVATVDVEAALLEGAPTLQLVSIGRDPSLTTT